MAKKRQLIYRPDIKRLTQTKNELPFVRADVSLQDFSDMLEEYDFGELTLCYTDGSVANGHDIYWIRDHYLEPHKTDDITKILRFELYA